ncbi:MAG: PKD domain-containing protein [Flavobacteriales bacterium]|nr:PKD domain-containing protein [Flavobacteriales bacterium]
MLRNLLLVILLGSALLSRATHFSGGEIYWECLGNNQYRITLMVYRDCAGINVDPTVTLQLNSPCGNTSMTVSHSGPTEISQLCGAQLPNSTCNGGPLPGIQQFTYTGIITLAPCDAWTISYTNIYRNNAIINLQNPGTQRTYIRAVVNTTVQPCNDSPQFSNTAIPYVCLGYPITYSFGAWDPEGDSLSYTLINAMGLNGASIPYVPPYTATDPIPGLTLDPITGEVNFTLTAQGNWVVVVQVNHWVNGVLVGSVMRDMQFVAYPCANDPPDPATGVVTGLTGSAVQLGPRSIQVCESGSFCFDLSISDPNLPNVLTAFSNVGQNLPGATFTYTPGNPLTGQICWTAAPNTSGFFPFIVNVNDGACPIPAFQTYIYSVTVIAGLYGTVTTTNEDCLGTGNGTATANVSAGTAPFTYAWSTGATTPSIGAGPGTYTVTMTDANNCMSPPISGTIGTTGLPNSANAGPDAVGCVGSFPVTLGGSVVNATGAQWSGGAGSFSGTWPNIGYTPTASEIAAGSVQLTLTTTGNTTCPPASDQMILNLPNSFANAVVTPTDAICFGTNTGSATFSPALPGFTYAWTTSPVQTGVTATSLGAGNYSVTATDAYGCTITLSTTIGPIAATAIASLTSTDETCAGFGDGTATVVATGGTPPYSYTWSNGGTGSTIIAGAGTYTVSVTDANNCAPATGSITINAAALPNQADAGNDLVGCVGAGSIALNGIVVNATGGLWSGGGGTFTGAWPTVSYSPGPSDIDSNGVTLTLTTTGNNACPPASDQVFVNIPNSFAGTGITSTDADCNGGATGSASVVPSDPTFIYQWSDGSAQTTASASGLPAGAYSVLITDAFGCSTTLNTSVGQPSAIAISGITTTDETCAGLGDGSATVDATGGTPPYSYLWSTGATSQTISAGAGNYMVEVSDANNCAVAVGNATISALAQPNQADAGNDLVGCVGSFPILLYGSVVNASGGIWSGGSGTFNGTWPNVTYTPGAADIASNGVTLTFTTVGNSNCPAASDQAYISIPNSFAGLTISSADADCNGATSGSATVSPSSPAFTYAWNDPAGQTTPTATGLMAGTISVVVTDPAGCTTTLTTVIGQPSALAITGIISTDETCAGMNDGTASVSVTGGTPPYSYLWNNGATTPSITAGAGNYIIGVTDANNCAVVVGTTTINELGQPNQANAGPDLVACLNTYPISLNGNVVNATGGQWSGGTGTILGNAPSTQYMPSSAEILAGSVTLTLTTTGNTTCPPASDQVTISLSNAFIGAGISATNVDCFGNDNGSIAFAPDAPGNTYLWNDPLAQTTPSAVNLGPGVYSVTVTDALGCDTTLSATISQPPALAITALNTSDVTCNGGNNGTANVQVSGGTPGYAFAWSGGQVTATIVMLQAGNLSVLVTDANGCTAQANGSILQPPPITVQASVPDTVCVNAPVPLVAQASGGTGNLTYNWGPLGIGNPITASFANSQNVQLTVTDQNGCSTPTLVLPITVLDLNTASFTTYGDTTICPGGNPATVGALLNGYPGSYTLNWVELGSSGHGPFTVPFTTDQDLHVIVTDQCGNTMQRTIALRVQVPPQVSLPAVIAQGCAPLTVTFPDLQLGQGISYLWTLGNGNTSASPMPVVVYQAGNYSVGLTVSTPLGCTSTAPSAGLVNAWQPPLAGFTASTYNTSADNATINFTDQSSGSIANWSWLFGDGGTGSAMNPSHTYTDVGTFEVTLFVTDVNGCTGEASADITITPIYDITIPTAFTPNGNGSNGGSWDPNDLSNDVFYPFIRFVKDFRMRVFNRWGELVFESEDVRIGWDGYYRNEISPQDVYVVQTWVRFIDGKEIQKLTDLTLFR